MCAGEHARNRQRQKESQCSPYGGKKYPTSDHQSEHTSFLRSKRHPQSDFVSSLRHNMRNHAVDSHSREAQGQDRKRAEKSSEQAITCALSIEHLSHCLDVANRLILINSPDGLPNRRRESGGIPAANHHDHSAQRALEDGYIHLGNVVALSYAVDDVSDNSDDLARIWQAGQIWVRAYKRADRVRLRKEPFHKSLIDDDYFCGTGSIRK